MSNPPVFSLIAMLPSLKLIASIGVDQLRLKSLHLTGYLSFLLRALPEGVLTMITPDDPHESGAQLSFRLNRKVNGEASIEHLLLKENCVIDSRDDLLRVSPAPVYNNCQDVHTFVIRFCHVLLKHCQLSNKEQKEIADLITKMQAKYSVQVVQDKVPKGNTLRLLKIHTQNCDEVRNQQKPVFLPNEPKLVHIEYVTPKPK